MRMQLKEYWCTCYRNFLMKSTTLISCVNQKLCLTRTLLLSKGAQPQSGQWIPKWPWTMLYTVLWCFLSHLSTCQSVPHISSRRRIAYTLAVIQGANCCFTEQPLQGNLQIFNSFSKWKTVAYAKNCVEVLPVSAVRASTCLVPVFFYAVFTPMSNQHASTLILSQPCAGHMCSTQFHLYIRAMNFITLTYSHERHHQIHA